MKRKILIIDDSTTSREYIKYCFYEFDNFVEILFAENTLKAKKLMEENDISLVILDWNLPGENGIDFLMTIKNDENKKNIPVIMISGESYNKENIIKAAKIGVDDFLIKPFSKKDIVLRSLSFILSNIDIKVYSKNNEFIDFINKVSKKLKISFNLISSIEEINEKEYLFIDYEYYIQNKNKLDNVPIFVNLNINDQKSFENLTGKIQYITNFDTKIFYEKFLELLFKSLSQKHVLVISYSTTIRKIIKSISVKLNYVGIESENFIEGYRYIFNNYKDIHSIFIDYDEFDNLLSFLEKLEANIFFKDIKVNIIGSVKSTEELYILSKYRINSYILKPFTLGEIIKKILD